MRNGLGRRTVRVRRGFAVLAAVGALAGCQQGAHATGGFSAAAASTRATDPATSSSAGDTSSSAAPTTPAGEPVRVMTAEGDGRTYGVGMPLIVYFSKKITDASGFRAAAQVTVDGQLADGAWWFEPSQRAGYALEAHYRLAQYWPAHATIAMALPLQGVSAGPGLVFTDDLSLSVRTGAAHLAAVDGVTHRMTITSDGAPVRTLQVSLGKASTPTLLGTAVVMAKANPEEMKSDPGETPAYDLMVPWSVRVTNDGEFVHDASWNHSIGAANLSHGCTNLAPADAEWYFGFAQVGDPITWTRTGTSKVVPPTDGWGDWNVDWSTWSAGGLLPTA